MDNSSFYNKRNLLIFSVFSLFVILLSLTYLANLLSQREAETEDTSASVSEPKGATLTVCASGIVGVDGCQYIGGAGIQQAVDASKNGDTVLIKNGKYTNVGVRIGFDTHPAKQNIKIQGEGNINTILEGTFNRIINIEGNSIVTIENLTIKKSGIGIIARDQSQVTISNNRIYAETGTASAIYIDGTKATISNNYVQSEIYPGIFVDKAQVNIIDNTIIGVNSNGISCSFSSRCNIINNIVVSSGKIGITARSRDNIESLKYNLSYGNGVENFDSFYNAQELSEWGNLQVDPKFVSATDFHLQTGSPARNAGDPNIKNPNGSRSDMGMYGGPGGATESLAGFSNLSATMEKNKATFNFAYTGPSLQGFNVYIAGAQANLNGTPAESRLLGSGSSSPIVVTPINQTNHPFYNCGATIYWKMKNVATGVFSTTQNTVVNCVGASSTPIPSLTPTPGLNLTTNFVNGNNVRLNWNIANASGVTGYEVQSCNQANCNSYSAIYTTTGLTTYTDTRPWEGVQLRRYRVRAVNAADSTVLMSNTVDVVSPIYTPPVTASVSVTPTPGLNLTTHFADGNNVRLNWNIANASGVTGYEVQSCNQANCNSYSAIYTATGLTTYTDTRPWGNDIQLRRYRVRAVNAADSTVLMSNTVDVKSPVYTPPVTPSLNALTCTKTHSLANNAVIGSNVTYTIKLSEKAPGPNGTVIVRDDFDDNLELVEKPTWCVQETSTVQSAVLGISDVYSERGSVLISIVLFSALAGGAVYLIVLHNRKTVGWKLIQNKPYLAGLLAAGAVLAVGSVYFLVTQDDVSPTDTPALTGKYWKCNVPEGTDTITYKMKLTETVGSKVKNIAEVQTGTNPSIQTCSTEFTVGSTNTPPPTNTPSVTPTVDPTITPSVTPTIDPTITPSVTPTQDPNTTPVMTETPVPSEEPTAIVTDPPTGFICGKADVNNNGTFDIQDFGGYQVGFASHYQKTCDDTEEMRQTYMPCGGKDSVPGTDGNFGKIDILDFASFAQRYTNETCDLYQE